VKSDHTGEVRAAARELEHRRASEAEADGGNAAGVDVRLRAQCRECAGGAQAQLLGGSARNALTMAFASSSGGSTAP
jgi:hypothetical protein